MKFFMMTDSTSEIRNKLHLKVLKSRILLLNKFYKHKIQLISVDSTQNSLPIYFDAITTRFYLLVLSYKYYLSRRCKYASANTNTRKNWKNHNNFIFVDIFYGQNNKSNKVAAISSRPK